MTLKKYHRVRDSFDARDFIYTKHLTATEAPPSAMDLRIHCPPVYDQGQLGSCTANAIVGAIAVNQIVQGEPLVPLSRLFVYWNERNMEHDVSQDGGAQIRDGIQSVSQLGVCQEQYFPYVEETFKNKPSMEAFADGLKHKALKYERVPQTIDALTHCVGIELRPIVIGIEVYSSFESDEVAKSGLVPIPQPHEKNLGGHAILIVGYDIVRRLFLVRNSWGPDWGDGGYVWFPFDFILSPNLTSDFWAITSIS